ncbi:MAG: hypothetical protein WBX01_14565 [Nitrososphaeraceae archaeon]
MREIAVTELHTYTSMQTSEGTQYGGTKGIVMTKDGTENATFAGHRTGYVNEAEKMKYTGSIFFKSLSKGKAWLSQ